MTVVANLKQQGDYYNYGQRTVGDLAHELTRDGLAKTWRERSMWAAMRMTPTDILGRLWRHLHLSGQRPAPAGELDRVVPGPASGCGCASSTLRP